MKFNTLQVMNTDEKTQSCDIVLPNKYCVVPENIDIHHILVLYDVHL